MGICSSSTNAESPKIQNGLTKSTKLNIKTSVGPDCFGLHGPYIQIDKPHAIQNYRREMVVNKSNIDLKCASEEEINAANCVYTDQWLESTTNRRYQYRFHITQQSNNMGIGVITNDKCLNKCFTELKRGFFYSY